MIETILLTTRRISDMKLSAALKLLIPIARANNIRLHTAAGLKRAVELLTDSIKFN